MSDLIKAEHLRLNGEILLRSPDTDPTDLAGEEGGDPRMHEAARYARLHRELVARQDEIIAQAQAEADELLADTRGRAERLLTDAASQAGTEAARTLAAAREEARRLREEAVEQGRQEGVAETRRQMAGMIEDLTSLLASIVEEARRQVEDIRITAEPQAVALSLAIARRVLEGELSDGGAALSAMIAASLGRLRDKRDLRLRVSPRDLGRATEVRHDLLAALDGVDGIEIVGDPRVDAGAIIETPMGTVDATLRGQLAEIEGVLRGLFGEEEGAP